MKALFIFLTIWSWHSLIFAQPQDLSRQIDSLNNLFLYEESVDRLIHIADDLGTNRQDRFDAYLLLSDTYKRLGDYNTVNSYLDKAKPLAKSTAEYHRLLAKRCFMLFDLKDYDHAQRLQAQFDTSGFEGLTADDVNFLKIQQGYYYFRDKDYQQALLKYNEILQAIDSCHSPIIHSKVMETYYRMGELDTLTSIYDAAVQKARQCKILKYEYHLASVYYLILYERNELELASYYAARKDSLFVAMREIDHLSSLYQLEQQELRQHSEKLKTSRSTFQTLFIILLIACLGLLVRLYIKQKRQRKMEAEMAKMQLRIEDYLSRPTKADIKDINSLIDMGLFTDRQIEIIRLIKQKNSNREIAGHLHISVNTVKYHVKNIYRIIEAHDVTFNR